MSGSTAPTSLWVAGQPADAASLAAFQTNYGHLSTMQVRGGAVQGLERHLQRLDAANRELFGAPLTADRVRQALASALIASGQADATLRVSVGAVDAAAIERGGPVEVVVLVALSSPRTPPATPQHVRSHVHVRPLAHLKHLATLPLLQARRQARAAGADDAVLVDADGRISEGALWNIGFIFDAGIVWPEAAALRGTAEAALRAGLTQAGIAQSERVVRRAECSRFDAAFACNSSGVWPLASIDAHRLPGDGAMLARLRAIHAAQPWVPLTPG